MNRASIQGLFLCGCLFALQVMVYAASDKDVAAGEALYVQCSGCHAPAYNRAGPRHCDLLGRKAATQTGFEYTEAMRESGLIWTETSLDGFLQAPMRAVPGTSMGFIGVASASERRQLIAYLASLNDDNPLCQ